MGHWEYDKKKERTLIFNGEKYDCRYYDNLYSYGADIEPRRKYRELRIAELREEQKLIREYCYG